MIPTRAVRLLWVTGAVCGFAGTTWTLPSLADGRLFLRDREQLVSLDISE